MGICGSSFQLLIRSTLGSGCGGLTGVAQAGGEAVYGEQDRPLHARVRLRSAAVLVQQGDLQQVKRLQVGRAHLRPRRQPARDRGGDHRGAGAAARPRPAGAGGRRGRTVRGAQQLRAPGAGLPRSGLRLSAVPAGTGTSASHATGLQREEEGGRARLTTATVHRNLPRTGRQPRPLQVDHD